MDFWDTLEFLVYANDMEDSTILWLLTLLCIQWFVCQYFSLFGSYGFTKKKIRKFLKIAILEACPGLYSRVILNFWELHIIAPLFLWFSATVTEQIWREDRAKKNLIISLALLVLTYASWPGIPFRISSEHI